MKKPFKPYTVHTRCIRNNDIDRSTQTHPLIESIEGERRYPMTPEGLLLVEPTPSAEITSLHSISLEAPIEVWSGEPDRLVYFDLLAFRKSPLISPEKGLTRRLRSKIYPIEECRLETLFTSNEVPALVALLLDWFPDVTTVWTCEYPIPIREGISCNYACHWGGNLRMTTFVEHGPFDFGTTKLNLYFDAAGYPPQTEDELPLSATQLAEESVTWNWPLDENGEELPF